MQTFEELILPSVNSVCIVGHLHPDGDCLGSETAVYKYIRTYFPWVAVTLFTKDVIEPLKFLVKDIPYREDDGENDAFDLGIAVDAASLQRIPAGLSAYQNAKQTVCIDHHITNPGFADVNVIEGHTSSACEVLCKMMDPEKINADIAVSLYTGLAHDTGVFRFPNVKPITLRFAADLVEKEIPFAKIIEESYSSVSYNEMRIMGEVMSHAELYPEEKFIVSYADLELQAKYNLKPGELGAVVARLNEAREADFVLFFYQNLDGTWKGSLRSRGPVDVAVIAAAFGGGGHGKAAGFNVSEKPWETTLKIREMAKGMRE